MSWQVQLFRLIQLRKAMAATTIAVLAVVSGCGGGGGGGGGGDSPTAADPVASPPGISLIAGAVGGQSTPGTTFGSNSPGVGADASGNIYVMDGGNVRIVSTGGAATTRNGGANLISALPMGPTNEKTSGYTPFAVDKAGNVFAPIKTYDGFNGGISRLDRDGNLTTVPGSQGLGAIAVAVDAAGNVFAIDDFNISVRKITPAGSITTIARLADLLDAVAGPFGAACSEHYFSIAVDPTGNVFIASSQRVRRIDATGAMSVLAGSSPTQCRWSSGTLPTAGSIKDGSGDQARFLSISSIAVDGAGNVFVADANTIRKISPAGVVSTVAGNPSVIGVKLGVLPGSLTGPSGVAVLPSAADARLAAMDERSLLSIVLK